MRIPDETLLKTVWNYLTIETILMPADVIIVGGSNDMGTSAIASELYNLGFAPTIVFSGFKEPGMDGTESDLLATAAEQRGVPADAIIRETQASNTGDNIFFSQNALKERGIIPSKVILIHKPYMTRRFLATAQAQWDGPLPEFIVAHQDISIDNYYLTLGRGEVIRKMLGDFKRMKAYAKKGYQTSQDIPEEVQQAYNELVERGHQIR
jgi:uncharacterized SAM-binding protein YcdF (DUF218 family)